MLDLRRLSSDEKDASGLSYADRVKASLKKRGASPEDFDRLLEANETRKRIIKQVDSDKHSQNQASEQIALGKKNSQDVAPLLAEMKEVAARVKVLSSQLSDLEKEVEDSLLCIPNLLHKSTPKGESEDDNQLVKTWGEPGQFDFEPLDHASLGVSLNILDFDRAAKVSGSRFSFLKGTGARLERALTSFMLDHHRKNFGYEEISPPAIVNRASLTGCGQLPKFEDDVFHLAKQDYFLIPTAEVPVTLYHGGEILSEDELPKKYVAASPCFRSEAGSYGKDVKGLIRQHQFTKVELVHLARPCESYESLEKMLKAAESILQALELPYRVVSLCSGDIGFSAAKTYDLEVWLPSQKTYREISSCSNCEDFQARRSNIRFRSADLGKPQFVHTLNGSGLAVGRTLVAILENYQTSEGGVKIPAALQPYLDETEITQP